MIRFVCLLPDAHDGRCWLVMEEADVASGPDGCPLFLIDSTHYNASQAREAMQTLEDEAAVQASLSSVEGVKPDPGPPLLLCLTGGKFPS